MYFHKEEIFRDIIKGINKIIDCAIFLFCLFVFSICIYAVYDNALIYQAADNSEILSYKPTANEDSSFIQGSVAWLTIPDTNIDYPIMQGESNDEYLNKDPMGEYSLSGSIFLDSRNSSFFDDPYNLIYGHHMEQDMMFGGLDTFSDNDYFATHNEGTLIAKTKTYTIHFFSFIHTSADIKLIFSPLDTDKEELLSYLKKNASIYNDETVSMNKEGNIVALSTCGDAGTIDRTVVFGFLEENHAATK